ncbi:MAG: hypothetical protein Q8N26_22755 [Myxococcales bacterium]|nr:hypothetical protein [Myxococcales bacterium]
MRRVATCALLTVSALGCVAPATPDFSFSSDRYTFDGRSERAIVSIQAFDERGNPGTGIVQLTAAVGTFVEGDQVALVAGTGSATFRCAPAEEAACAGPVRLGATWRGENRALTVRVTPSDPLARPLWRVVPTMQAVSLHAAALAPNRTVWAVGEMGAVLPFFANGTWGAPAVSGVTSTLRAISIASDGVLTIVGDDGVVLVGPPSALRRLSHTCTESFTAALRHKEKLFVATSSGMVGVYDTNDFVLSRPSMLPLNALAPLGDEVVAVGDDGMFTSQGEEWVVLAAPVLARWLKVQVDADGLWALGRRSTLMEDPVLVQGPGPDWKSSSLPSGAVQAMAWGTGSADRYVATDTSIFRHQVGGTWEDLEAPSGGNAIVALGGTQVLVVGPPGISLIRVR